VTPALLSLSLSSLSLLPPPSPLPSIHPSRLLPPLADSANSSPLLASQQDMSLLQYGKASAGAGDRTSAGSANMSGTPAQYSRMSNSSSSSRTSAPAAAAAVAAQRSITPQRASGSAAALGGGGYGSPASRGIISTVAVSNNSLSSPPSPTYSQSPTGYPGSASSESTDPFGAPALGGLYPGFSGGVTRSTSSVPSRRDPPPIDASVLRSTLHTATLQVGPALSSAQACT
jgi:hypothetical protein